MVSKIGPIELTYDMNYEGRELTGQTAYETIAFKSMRTIAGGGSYYLTEAFSVTMETYKFTQILGLTEQEHMVYIDASETLDWDNIPIRGWYVIVDASIGELLRYDWVNVTLNVIKIDPSNIAYMDMAYTPGSEDGTTVEHTFQDDPEATIATTYQINEACSSGVSSTYWYGPTTPVTFAGTGVTPISGKWNFIGYTTIAGSDDHCFVTNKTKIYPPWTMEWTFEWAATPTSNYHHMDVYLTEDRPTSDTNYPHFYDSYDWIRVATFSRSTGPDYYFQKNVNGSTSKLVNNVSLGTNKNPTYKLVMDATGKVTFYYATTPGGSYTKKWGPTSTGANIASAGCWLNIGYRNVNTTTATMRLHGITVYNTEETAPSGETGESAIYPNVVPLPANCTPALTPDFYRESCDGRIPYYVTPAVGLSFVTDPQFYYDGSVKAFSSFNSGDTERQMFGTDDPLDTTTFNAHNGLIKIAATPPGVNLYNVLTPGTPTHWLNIRTGTGNEGDTDGFTAANGATLASSTTRAYDGSKSLKTTTAGANTGWFAEGFTTAASQTYKLTAKIWAPSGSTVSMYPSLPNFSLPSTITYSQVVGNGEWQNVSTSWTNATSPLVDRIVCLTNDAAAFDFYTDDIKIEGWKLLNTFSIGTGLVHVKLNDISPDHATIQFNDTYWELYRGKPNVYVTHANTPLVYTKQNKYYHDTTTTTTPSAGADIEMTEQFYTNVYNTGDTVGLQILQKYPTTLKSDSIPATEITGLGYYSTSASTPDNIGGSNALAKQWIKRTETKPRITRP